MSRSSPTDISNPLFVRFYRASRETAIKRGENEHRRRVPAGLTGRVVELGAGDGANFELHPTTVTEVIAVEPEPRLREDAERAAREAPVPIRVVPGTAEALPGDRVMFSPSFITPKIPHILGVARRG